jgi:hypothetical protein
MMLSVSDDLADGRSEAPGSRRLARASGKEEAGAPSTARFDLVVPTPQGCHFSNTTGDYTPVVSCNRCFFQPSPMVLPLMVEMANQGHELLRAKIGKASRWGRPAFCKARFSNGPFGVKRFQTIRRCSVDVSPAGSCFSSESALGPFHHGFRGRGGTIFGAALPSYRQ